MALTAMMKDISQAITGNESDGTLGFPSLFWGRTLTEDHVAFPDSAEIVGAVPIRRNLATPSCTLAKKPKGWSIDWRIGMPIFLLALHLLTPLSHLGKIVPVRSPPRSSAAATRVRHLPKSKFCLSLRICCWHANH